MRVLVVENDELNAMLLQMQLEGEGMRVEAVASSVVEALEMIQAHEPQLVFLDYWLARNENSSPVAALLQDRGIPFLVATGMETSQLPAVFNGGIKLAKPYTSRELIHALKQALAVA